MQARQFSSLLARIIREMFEILKKKNHLIYQHIGLAARKYSSLLQDYINNKPSHFSADGISYLLHPRQDNILAYSGINNNNNREFIELFRDSKRFTTLDKNIQLVNTHIQISGIKIH